LSVVVVATITPKPDQVEAVREAILAAVPKVHAEPGCELYAVHEGKGEFVMVERWETPEALKVHGSAEALTTLGGVLADKLAGPPDVRRLSAVPAGDTAKGAV
jgi:quinol monooxygenase YgiN